MSYDLSTTTMVQAFRRFTTAMAVLMVGTVVSLGIIGAVVHKATTVSPEVLQNREHFYSVVAGAESPNSPLDGLAIALRDKLKTPSPASELPESLTSFKVIAGKYGGMQDALGYDLFDNLGQACSECGALSADTQAKLLAIKQGNLQGVLRSELSATSPNTVPYSAGILLGVYLFGGTLLARSSVRTASGTGSSKIIIDWSDQHAKVRTGYKLLAPLFYLGSSRRFKQYDNVLKSRRQELGLADAHRSLKVRRKSILALSDDMPGRNRELQKVQALMNEIDEIALSERTDSEAVTDTITGHVRQELEEQRIRVRELGS